MPKSIDTAWKTHTMLHEWTAKVDTKASIVLTLEVALVALFVGLTDRGKLLENAFGSIVGAVAGAVGLGFLLLSVALAGWVVFPRLARSASSRDWKSNTLYFGHLRNWEPDALAEELRRASDDQRLGQLAAQLVAMAQVCWRKHAVLQYSMLSAGVGFVLLVVAIAFGR